MNVLNAAQAALLTLSLAIAGAAAAQSATGRSAGGGTADSTGAATKSDAGKSTAKLQAQDRSFVMKAAQAGHAEVETGKLAASQAGGAAVKQFGQKMVEDHGKAGDELARIAKGKGVEPPSSPDASHQAIAKRLQGLKGAEFDRAYIAAMVKDHDEAVKLFQTEAKSGKDAELKAFAEKTLPTLQEHQRMARDLSSSAGKSDGKSDKSGTH